MARDKLSAINDFTFSTRNQSYRSIPDKVFTSFSTEHCELSSILDWTATRSLGFLDHRPVCTRVSLASLCSGWIEYPTQPITRPRITIDSKSLTPEHETSLHTAVSAWRRSLSPSIAAQLLHDRPQPQTITPDDLASMHKALCNLFVDIPATVYSTGQQAGTAHSIYKTRSAGQTQQVLCWLQHYQLSLADLHAAKARGANRISKPARRAARYIRTQIYTQSYIRTALPTITCPFSTCLSTWTVSEITSHHQEIQELQAQCKKAYDHELYLSKQEKRRFDMESVSKSLQFHNPTQTSSGRQSFWVASSLHYERPCQLNAPPYRRSC